MSSAINPDMVKIVEEMRIQREKLDSYGEKLANFWPHVSFRIPAVGLHTWKYHRLINALLREFIEKADPENEQSVRVLSHRGFGQPNSEGGIGCVVINGIFVNHCKMYVCDGTKDSSQYNPDHTWKPWRGLIFRDHAEPNPKYTTAKVFTIADAFEEFLTSKGVKFKRINVVRERSK